MIDELYRLFRRNFPLVVRDEAGARRILAHESNLILDRRDERGELIGAAVVNGPTILMLCVDEAHRRRGIGTALLLEAEEAIRRGGHDEAVVGVGFDYLTPGVPTSRRYFPAVNERLDPRLDETASAFFEGRGYRHGWDCNCFDMRFPLSEYRDGDCRVGDTIDGVTYRWAGMDDLPGILACAADACPEFGPFYQDTAQYAGHDDQRVLAAAAGDEIVGALMVGVESEEARLGSIGCTMVRPARRGRGVATNLARLGTGHLRDLGLKEAFLSYTYSGLDRLYGSAGYRICAYYMMARKALK